LNSLTFSNRDKKNSQAYNQADNHGDVIKLSTCLKEATDKRWHQEKKKGKY
jgi:hypothetical protein